MQDALDALDVSMTDLSPEQWREKMEELAEELGFYQPLGDAHSAVFIDQGKTLLVTFETMASIRQLSDTHLPVGFDLVSAQGWSHLCLISDGDTWFREPRVYGFFDRMIDDGFFEDFDQVIFYGAGSCGYAASAFSVSAPGATVIAIQPQATLDPRMTEWDERFTTMRRTSFNDRYGYAPDMLDAAGSAFVIYDPYEHTDAMHAALFRRSNVDRIRMAHMGDDIQSNLIEMELLYRIITLAGNGKLTATAIHKLFRERRDHMPYLRQLMHRLDSDNRDHLTMMLCRNVTSRKRARLFRRRLRALEKTMANDVEVEASPEPDDS